MKKLFPSLLLAALILWPLGGGLHASAAGLTDHITVKSYDPNVDYLAAINRALKDGGTYAMQVGAIYEQQRNLKISSLKLPQKQTSYFSTYTTAAEILAAIEADSKPKYTEEDLDLLARIINAEAGCTWIPDWVQRCVGSVVLNRVKSPLFPNTIRGVIYQPGQYPPAYNGMINRKPDARTIANAKYLLENGSITPANVTGQNGVITGSGLYKSYYDSILGTTIYFCYT
ncbi:cell wall hydrolase [Oscillospiraceae bacterium 21-37]|uniref:cell wall hydrolase n=1 Tax=unclassified Neglectibacter TaxID=2632164 RepID=UPI001EF066C7|nr:MULTISPECIES: cell wall hydrolase [unclassified Neglectibacter]